MENLEMTGHRSVSHPRGKALSGQATWIAKWGATCYNPVYSEERLYFAQAMVAGLYYEL